MEVLYYCEKCGKSVYEKYGSGRFCSRECANSHTMTEDRRSNICKGLAKETQCECKFCGKKFNNLHTKASHEQLCFMNPMRRVLRQKIDRSTTKQKVTTTGGEMIELDVTMQYIDNYKRTHTTCEICGKELSSEADSKYGPKGLCIDHDHTTNKFRGLLCVSCNRLLGWYENHSDDIAAYLKSKSK